MENRAISLPESLTPSLDRSFVKDLTRVDEQMTKMVRSLRDDKTKSTRNPAADDNVLATLVLSHDDVERLREQCRSRDDGSLRHLSTFVIACAYAWTCFVKAREGEGERPVSFLIVGDLRTRLDLPETYFGNCIYTVGCYKRKAADIGGERGFVTAVEIISDLVKSFSSPRMVETMAQGFATAYHCMHEGSEYGYVAGSNRFGVYEMDMGWGRPVKFDVVSIRREGISMTERRDESGGAELGICMKKTEMDIVISLFQNGLQN